MEIITARHKLKTIIEIADDIGSIQISCLARELQKAIAEDNNDRGFHHNDNDDYNSTDTNNKHYNRIFTDYDDHAAIRSAIDSTRRGFFPGYCSRW